MATSDAGPGYDVVKGYKIVAILDLVIDTFGTFMTSHVLHFLFYEDVISVYYNTQEIRQKLTIDSQFIR